METLQNNTDCKDNMETEEHTNTGEHQRDEKKSCDFHDWIVLGIWG